MYFVQFLQAKSHPISSSAIRPQTVPTTLFFVGLVSSLPADPEMFYLTSLLILRLYLTL